MCGGKKQVERWFGEERKRERDDIRNQQEQKRGNKRSEMFFLVQGVARDLDKRTRESDEEKKKKKRET